MGSFRIPSKIVFSVPLFQDDPDRLRAQDAPMFAFSIMCICATRFGITASLSQPVSQINLKIDKITILSQNSAIE